MRTLRCTTLLWVTLTGCATNRTYPPEGCSFEVLTVPPASGFEEVGTIDIDPGLAGTNWPRTVGDLQAKIAPQVCGAGGDAIYARPNRYGMYVGATVLKRTAKSAVPVDVTTDGQLGCQFDTQCKGNRVCVKHECVDRSPSPGNTSG
jgi:hypothetical protein